MNRIHFKQHKLHVLIHIASAIIVLPYVGLALMFLFVGEAARARGIFAILDVVAYHASWFIGWGMYGFALMWIGLVSMGCIPRLQRTGSLFLCLLAVASLLVVVLLPSSAMGPGQLVFLFPCAAVATSSAWFYVRAGRKREISRIV